MMLNRKLAGLLMATMVAVGSGHAQMAARVPLTATTVAAVLTTAGLHTAAAEVELPAGLSAIVGEPQLHITAAELRPDGRLQVRLACGQPGACPPFVATIRHASAMEELADLAVLQKSSAVKATVAASAAAIQLRAGQHATLLLEDAHMRITVPVLAIDSGAPGATVRVSSLDRKQTYDGVVLGDGTIRGTLP